MYHIADLTNWAHHFHLPGHEAMEYAENLLKSKTFWAIVMLMTIIIALSIVAIFAPTETTYRTMSPYSPYYPYYP